MRYPRDHWYASDECRRDAQRYADGDDHPAEDAISDIEACEAERMSAGEREVDMDVAGDEPPF